MSFTLPVITTGYNTSLVNNNFQSIVLQFNTNVVYSQGGQNVMYQDFDLNSHNLLNVGSLYATSLYFNGVLTAPSTLTQLATNSVGTSNIIDGSITTTKLDPTILTPSTLTASIVGFKFPATGGASRTVQEREQDQITVKDFGAYGDGNSHPASSVFTTLAEAQAVYASCLSLTDEIDALAFLAARDYLQTNSDYRGGKIIVPSGHYILNRSIDFTAYATSDVHNIYIEGSGPDNTTLDFSTVPASTNGVTFNAGAHFGVSNLYIANATSRNLVIGEGNTVGGASYCSMFTVKNVRMQGAGIDNLFAINCYLGTIEDCWAKNAAGNNYNIPGYSTSLSINRCEASNAGSSNWVINGVAYSTFTSCGSDGASQYGYACSNMRGVVFNGCGSESNQKDNWLFYTSTASTTGIPSAAQDIHGIVLNGCFGLDGSLASPGTYATFVNANTQNSRPIEIKIIGGSATPATSSDRALILTGTSGQITCHKDLFNDADFTAADSLTGTYELTNSTVTGRRMLCSLGTAQAITTAVTTTVLLDTVQVNDLGGSLASGKITIPKSVNKVRVSASLDIAANTTGVRQMFLQHNGANLFGFPAMTINAVSAGDTVISGISAVLSVAQGDTFNVQVYQNSGGNLNVNTSYNTWLCVEAIN